MKYITNVKGNVTGVVQGDGAQVIIQNGEVITPRNGSSRLVKCKNKKCGQLVHDRPYCGFCGAKL